jgi:pimeloyl-ACP methyl ester carboxylesterase
VGLNVLEQGNGRPLVLLHGIGSACSAWAPVMDLLAGERRVFAYDLPGFGDSPALPDHVEPTAGALGHAVIEDLRRRGVEPPIDLAGNSLGGRIALELAKEGLARSVVAVSPAGLWGSRHPRLVALKLRNTRWGARRFPKLGRAVMRRPRSRRLALAVVMAADGSRVPAGAAVEAMDNFARADAFDAVRKAGRPPFTGGGAITVPVTVVWGDKDRLLTARAAQHRDELPPQTRWLELEDAGHVPMWDQPRELARLILEGTA